MHSLRVPAITVIGLPGLIARRALSLSGKILIHSMEVGFQ
jgi:hypothetical protein